MTPGRTGALSLFLAVLATAAPLRAQERVPVAVPVPPEPWGPRLEYSGLPGCMSEASFRDAVAVFYRGEDPWRPDAPDVVRVTFKKIAGGYRVLIAYTPPTGDPWPAREHTGTACTPLSGALVLSATMHVPDPPAPRPAPAPAPKPPPPEPSPSPPVPVTSPSPRVASAPIAELRFTPPPKPPRDPMDLTIALHTAFVLTAGFTDNAGPGLQIGASARYDWATWGLSLGLEVRGVFPGGVVARDIVDAPPGWTPFPPVPFDVSQLGGQLVPCVHFAEYFAGCGVVQGFLILKQTHIDLETIPGWGLGPRFAVEVPFAERFAVFGFAEALFPIAGVGQAFSDPPEPGAPGRVWDQSFVSGFFGAGVSVKFK